MKLCGIYKILNLLNNKVYVGQSINLTARIKQHRYELKRNKHHNSHLQSSYNKYGIDNFEYSIIEECDIVTLDEKEKYWIEYYNSTNMQHGYNIDNGGNSNKILSDETKNKISIATKLILSKPEVRKVMSYNAKNREITDERKRKNSESQKRIGNRPPSNLGKSHSEETKYKIGLKHKGKIISEESKLKISQSKQGHIPPNKIIETEEMIQDVLSGMKRNAWMNKYNLGRTVWDRIRKSNKKEVA